MIKHLCKCTCHKELVKACSECFLWHGITLRRWKNALENKAGFIVRKSRFDGSNITKQQKENNN